MMFCPYCGSKLHPESLPADTVVQEQVEGAIPLAVAKDGDEEGRMFTLIITGSLLIIAKTTEEDLNKINKASGSVFLGGAILEPERHRKSLGAYSRRYLSMDPGRIISESVGNTFLRTVDITGILISSEEDAEGDQFYLLAFETNVGLKRYVIPTDKDSRDLLISTFGKKVHW